MKRPAVGITIAVAAALVCLAALAGSAAADVGVEKVSRHAGRPGAAVKLTIGCGFCFPPCKGPKGHRHPDGFEHGPCMLGSDEEPPESFGVSLLPLTRAERLLECELHHRSRCARPSAPPRRAPYTYLGEATPPPGGNNPEHGDPPRYLLRFPIPRLPAGDYAFVIWCDACLEGRPGSLVVYPASPLWRLRVRPAASPATASDRMGAWPRRFASTNTATSTSSR